LTLLTLQRVLSLEMNINLKLMMNLDILILTLTILNHLLCQITIISKLLQNSKFAKNYT